MPLENDPGPATVTDVWIESDTLLAVLRRAGQLLDWEGESIVPEGPGLALIDYMAHRLGSASPLALALLQTLRRLYGAGVARVRRQVHRYEEAVERFVDAFGPGPVAVGRAPARINILGEHVDYVRYLPTEVLPFASREHDMLMVFRPSAKPVVRGRSTLAGAEPGEFRLADGPAAPAAPGRLEEEWLAYLREVGRPERSWLNYVKASVHYAAMKSGPLARGFDFLLHSTIPAAGGASSSSTIVILSGAAIRQVNGLACDPARLAEDSARAEWYIGTRGGNMDHATMCLSRRQHALRLSFSPMRTELTPLHRFRYRWVTFFSHAADKGNDVLLHYNERSAVSRLVIPALLERMLGADAALREQWKDAVDLLTRDREGVEPAMKARAVLERLPEKMTLGEVKRDLPAVFEEMRKSYPLLAEQASERELVVRSRALHHVGETIRVRQVAGILKEVFAPGAPEEPEKTEPGLRAVGDLITETHESMRDLYGLTTPDIDDLVEVVLSHPGVYGARLMGGGFGGNVLALISKEILAELVDAAQERYYGPRGRDGVAEGSVMVSTPGEGFGLLSLDGTLRQALINASAIWWKWRHYEPVVEKCAQALLGGADLSRWRPARPVQPVVVAGGRGATRLDGDYRNPGALSVLGGRTALERVLAAIEAMPFKTLPPIVVVSPEMTTGAMDGMELPPGTRLAVQTRSLGTGDAVMAAAPLMNDPAADALVVWGSQALLTPRTLARSVMLHQALGSEAMVFPTAVTRRPYAPIRRDLHGYVTASMETAWEGAPTRRLGETNVGAFVISCRKLSATLSRLRDSLWDKGAGRYATVSGELGFPNEMARALVAAGESVVAFPIAQVEESVGLRSRAAFEEVKRALAAREGG